MFIYSLFNIFMTILFIIAIGYIAFKLFCRWQGDERIVFFPHKRSTFILEDITFNQVVLSCEVPYRNVGKQNGTIMDCYPRHLLPYEQFDRIHVESWLTNLQEQRPDGYWKALIVEPQKGGKVLIKVILHAITGNIKNDVQNFPDMNIDIVYQVVGRSEWHIAKSRITLTAEEVREAMKV